MQNYTSLLLDDRFKQPSLSTGAPSARNNNLVLEILQTFNRQNSVFSFMVLTYCQSLDFKHARISSAFVPFDITGRICLKCPDKTTVIPPIRDWLFLISLKIQSIASKALICIIVYSSNTIKWQCLITSAYPKVFIQIQVKWKFECRMSSSNPW